MSTVARSHRLILPDRLAVSTQLPLGWMACGFSRQQEGVGGAFSAHGLHIGRGGTRSGNRGELQPQVPHILTVDCHSCSMHPMQHERVSNSLIPLGKDPKKNIPH